MNRTELHLRVPCKINLSLEVVGKRADGYHQIRTVMQAVSLCDELRVRARQDGRIELSCSDSSLPTGHENLVVRAARELRRRCAGKAGASIHLEKRIPAGGGLGGGSADAAVTLLALRDLWQAPAGRDELAEAASAVGSDVPFFLRGGTALCEGRGELVSPVASRQSMHYVIVTPPVSVSTAAVYAASTLTPSQDKSTKVVDALRSGEADQLGRCLCNDLQVPSLDLHPELRNCWSALRAMEQELGLEGLLLSGSGSSFFGVARGREHAAQVARDLQRALQIPCVPVRSLLPWEYSCALLTLRR